MRYTIGIGSRAPASVIGRRSPSSAAITRAPIRRIGSSIRFIGRRRSEASPSNVAVIGHPPAAPMTSRQPVPELPKSRAAAGAAKPPTPTPSTCHFSSPQRSTRAPSARIARAVLITSSPSRSPEITVRPTASAPMISARCEIDLSPGARRRPFSGPDRRAAMAVWELGADIFGIRSARPLRANSVPVELELALVYPLVGAFSAANRFPLRGKTL